MTVETATYNTPARPAGRPSGPDALSVAHRAVERCRRCGYGRLILFTSGLACYQCSYRPDQRRRSRPSAQEHRDAAFADAMVSRMITRATKR